MRQTETHYLGLVVTKKQESLLADLTIQDRPTVNDLPLAALSSTVISGSRSLSENSSLADVSPC